MDQLPAPPSKLKMRGYSGWLLRIDYSRPDPDLSRFNFPVKGASGWEWVPAPKGSTTAQKKSRP